MGAFWFEKWTEDEMNGKKLLESNKNNSLFDCFAYEKKQHKQQQPHNTKRKTRKHNSKQMHKIR